MELVLHIGAPKTGTTSLQEALERGRSVLAGHGWYYPAGMDGHPRNHNALTSNFKAGRLDRIRNWYATEKDRAQRAGCERMLISGESLFRVADDSGLECAEDYPTPVDRVRALINALGEPDVRAVVYLRPQPEFAESLYHLAVKRADGYGGDLQSYLPRIQSVLDYETVVGAWADVVGADRITLVNYAAANGDIIGDFSGRVLDIPATELPYPPTAMNTRASREYLAVKRVLNRIPMSSPEAYAYKQAMAIVFASMEGLHYGAMLDQGIVRTLRDSYASANHRLFERLGGGQPNLRIAPEDWPDSGASDALDAERAVEALARLEGALKRPQIRVGRWLRSVAPERGPAARGARRMGRVLKRAGWIR